MKLERGAIRISGGERSKVEMSIKNVILEGLPSFAITVANMEKLVFEGVLITSPAETAAVNLQLSSSSLTLNKVDARAGLSTGWISGDLTDLNITKSRLNLGPGALSSLIFTETNSSLVVRENVFGSNQWGGPFEIYPTLTNKVFDFTFKKESATLNIADNSGKCSEGNLNWFYSPKSTLVLHWLRCGMMNTFKCLDGSERSLPEHSSCNFEEIDYVKEFSSRGKRSEDRASKSYLAINSTHSILNGMESLVG